MTYPVITSEYIEARIHQWETMLDTAKSDVERATVQLEKWRIARAARTGE